MKVKRKTVLIEKSTGDKFVVREEKDYDENLYEFVCDRPHEDGDYSYLCGNEYCRCLN